MRLVDVLDHDPPVSALVESSERAVSTELSAVADPQ